MKTVSLTLGMLLAAAMCRAQGNEVLYRIDFGPRATCEKGWIPIQPDSSDIRFCWRGMGIGMRDRGGDDLLLRDLIHGEHGEFIAGLENGDYEIEMTFGDKSYPHGPFNVFVQGKLVFEKLETRKGEFVTKKFKAHVSDEKLRIRIVPVDAPNFTVTSIVIKGPKQTKEHSAYDEAPPPKEIPTLAEINKHANPDVKAAFKRYCEWLLRYQLPNGFFNWNSREWYRTGYPIRTLLAGYDIFGDKRYLDAVTKALDQLVGEQLPNGAWSSSFRGKPVSESTPEEIQHAMSGTTNMADVGSISVCLAVAYPYVDAKRRKTYKNSLKRFADEYAAQWQLESGAFTNARWSGQDMTTPYSVATGTQGMSFIGLYAITGDEKYLKIGERAARFLLDNWQEDGRPIHHHHAKDTTSVHKSTAFGDVYYYHEAILWAWHYTRDDRLKEQIKRVYKWHIKGSAGLLAARENGVWWPVRDTWTNSKAGGMLSVLFEYDHFMCPDPEVHEAVRRGTIFLCTPEYAERIGVMVNPEVPWGKFSMAATGFAGVSLAEIVQPGVIFLKSKKAKAGLR